VAPYSVVRGSSVLILDGRCRGATLQAYWSLLQHMVPPGASGKFKVRTGGFPDCDVMVVVSKDCFMGLFLGWPMVNNCCI
jgi:hypothetical protein